MRSANYFFYVAARGSCVFSMQLLLLVVALAIYDRTGNPWHLGLAGLMIFIPSILMMPLAGIVADRRSRQLIVATCFSIIALCSATLTWLQATGALNILPVFVVLGIVGTAKAFYNPTLKSLLVNVVALDEVPRAVAFNTSMSKVAGIAGPVAGGLLYATNPSYAYATAAIVMTLAAVFASLVHRTNQVRATAPLKPRDFVAGFHAIMADRILFAAMTLDLLAVLLGGATALLPVYAKEVLFIGPAEVGVLRATLALGTLFAALLLAWRPLRGRAGQVMLLSFVGYGASIAVFGASTSFWLSMVALLVAGSCDMISIYVRESLIQLRTPDEVRGRVNAINAAFNSGANELGDFRAGSSAALIGAMPAVVIGGLCSMAVAAVWALRYPDLRRLDRL